MKLASHLRPSSRRMVPLADHKLADCFGPTPVVIPNHVVAMREL